MRSQQGRSPAGRGRRFSLTPGLVAAGAALAALYLSTSRSSVARAEPPPSPAAGPADLILTHGRIYTLDAQKPWAQALAIRGRPESDLAGYAWASTITVRGGQGTAVNANSQLLGAEQLESREHEHRCVGANRALAVGHEGRRVERWQRRARGRGSGVLLRVDGAEA